jgi:uncharacterized membrane protein
MTALHVVGLLLWVGSLVSAFVAASVTSCDDTTRKLIATRLYRWVARPGFWLAFTFGAIRLGMDWHHYLVATHFMHAKLMLALVAVVAHHFVGARIGSSASARAFHTPATTSAVVLFGVSCLATVIIVVVRPM